MDTKSEMTVTDFKDILYARLEDDGDGGLFTAIYDTPTDAIDSQVQNEITVGIYRLERVAKVKRSITVYVE